MDRLSLLFLLALLPATVLAQEFCNICGEGPLANPDATFPLPAEFGGPGTVDCATIDFLARDETFREQLLSDCGGLQAATFGVCCDSTGPAPVPTPTLAPIPAPTLAPVLPTLAPVIAPRSALPTFEPNTVGPDLNTVLSAFGFASTLRLALELTNLEAPLTEPNGPFTLFAPTDMAFGKLPEGTVEALIMPENLPVLEDILLYHVAPGIVRKDDLVDGLLLETLLGPTIQVTRSGVHRQLGVPNNSPGLTLNGSTRIIFPNLGASNGIVHVIDEVLIPPGMDPEERMASIPDIAGLITGSPEFSILLSALVATDLAEAFIAPNGPFTVFAPTNEAFASWPPGLLDQLLLPERKEELTSVLLYHVLEGQVLSTDLVDGASATTLLGDTVTVSITDGDILINKSPVVQADIRATNGVVHAISMVLFPPDFVFV